MRSNIYRSVLAGTAIALAAPVLLPGSAEAATVQGSCTQTGLAAANLSSLLGPGTSDLVPGPSCTMQATSPAGSVARLKVTSAAGLVSGQMKLRTISFFGVQEKTLTCAPALNTCEATTPVPSFIFTTTTAATCSVTGVVAVLASVSCSIETP